MAIEHQVNNVKSAMILMVAAFGFALLGALVKMVGQSLPVTQVLFLRQLGMTAMLVPVISQNALTIFKTDHVPLHLTRIFLALITLLASFTALVYLPLADATAISFSKSFFVTIFAVLILNEVVGFHRWLAVLVGFVGVLIMMHPGSEGFSVFGFLAVVGAASGGLLMVIIRKLTRVDSPATIMAYQAIGLGIVMAIPALIQWVAPTPYEWFLLVAIGVVSYFSQKANILAYKYGEASMLAPLEYVRLLYAAVFGWFLFSELSSLSTWIGAAIIFGASVFTINRERKASIAERS